MAVFMAAIMSGCGNSADNQIMDEVLRDIPNVTEPTALPEVPGTGIESFTTTEATESETEASETESTLPEADAEPRLAQQEDLIGAWFVPATDKDNNVIEDDMAIILFTDSTVILLYEDVYMDEQCVVKDGLYVPAGSDSYAVSYDDGYITVSGDEMYFNVEGYEPIVSYRYEHEPVALDYFDGEYISVFYEGDDIGSVTIENGTSISGLDMTLSLSGDRIRVSSNGETIEYSYYILETEYMERYIYFVNDDSVIIFFKDIDE